MSTVPVRRFGPVEVHFGEKQGKYPDGNQVIVQGAELRVAFDAPQVANRIGRAFDTVDAVILGHVHEDHMAGLHRLPRAPVYVHEADLAAARSWDGLARHYGYPQPVLDALLAKIRREFHYQPRPDAIGYADGAVWDLGGGVRVRAVHMPGHTAGHCVLLVEPHGVAFLGDIELSSFGPYYGDATSSLAQFRETLRRVPELPAAVWITSHHKGVYTDRDEFLAALARFAATLDARGERLLAMLDEGPRSLDELVAQRLVYPPEYAELWVDCAERLFIARHLAELQACGRVREVDAGRYARAGS
jgi:glyoxylase-like metal-dependent hydrolase (beta-lactamase superfamily II)